MGVGDLSLTPILNFKGERLQARTGPLYPPPSPPPSCAVHNIKNNIVITKKTCRIRIVAVMGKGSTVN